MDKMKELLLGSMKQERTWLLEEMLGWGCTVLNVLCCLWLLSPHRIWLNWGNLAMLPVFGWMIWTSRRRRIFWRTKTELILHAMTCKPEVMLEAYDQLLAHLSRK